MVTFVLLLGIITISMPVTILEFHAGNAWVAGLLFAVNYICGERLSAIWRDVAQFSGHSTLELRSANPALIQRIPISFLMVLTGVAAFIICLMLTREWGSSLLSAVATSTVIFVPWRKAQPAGSHSMSDASDTDLSD